MEATAPTTVLGITSLDPTETKSHALRVQSTAQLRVHSKVWHQRERNISAFERSGDSALEKRAGRMGLCCVTPVLRIEQGRVPVISPGRCRDRLCPLCSRVRGRVARDRIRGLVSKADSVRLITLTQPASKDDLATVIKRLFDGFQKLRRTRAWKDHVTGGLFVCEITTGEKGEHWHAHLHVLAEGSYLHFKTLSAAWSAAMGVTCITDIRAVHGRQQAANYVTKYVTKGAETGGWTNERICDFARGVHRTRLYGTFGKWHKADVNRDDDDDQPNCPKHSVSLAQIVEALERRTLDPDVFAPLVGSLGFVGAKMVEHLNANPLQEGTPTNARTYEVLTLFGMDLINEQPPPPPPPDRAREDRWTRQLFGDASNGRML